ncbi:hypothetical protein SLS62_005425 [Diatrype stigma]|uniref:Prolyl 4-hydroxylase alpha subunit domain-containing protein n=1 Tax=Diatrype stigma TaxID=117547 RepID=A0AAN9USS8_9PEZI
MLKHSVLLLLAAASAHGSSSQEDGSSSQKPMGVDYVCQHPQYQTRIVSTSPFVIYIENFLTAEEREHLLDTTKDTFAHSAVADEAGAQGLRQTRTSQSTNVPRDAVARCVEARALHFQGYYDGAAARARLEPLQLVRYARGERFHFHTDWYGAGSAAALASAALGGNRESSFFVYVAASNSSCGDGEEEDLTGGGTNFPMLELESPPRDPRWCALVDCDEPWEAGVTFRPVVGNAVFWRNVLEDGAGDQRTLHAGLPVTSGWKVGMNIWTRQGPLSEDIRGPDVY